MKRTVEDFPLPTQMYNLTKETVVVMYESSYKSNEEALRKTLIKRVEYPPYGKVVDSLYYEGEYLEKATKKYGVPIYANPRFYTIQDWPDVPDKRMPVIVKQNVARLLHENPTNEDLHFWKGMIFYVDQDDDNVIKDDTGKIIAVKSLSTYMSDQ